MSLTQRVPAELAEQVFAHLPRPDLVLFLRIGAAETLRRKDEFTSLEAGHTGNDEADFIRYQDTVLAQLHSQQESGGWLPLDVTGKVRETVLKEAATALEQRLELTFA